MMVSASAALGRRLPAARHRAGLKVAQREVQKFGVLLGGLTIGTITNGLNILNVSSYWQKVVMGALIIASVALEKLVGSTVKNK